MQRSASDSVGLIFTRSHRSTLLITTPTTTPSLVKTSLKRIIELHNTNLSKYYLFFVLLYYIVKFNFFNLVIKLVVVVVNLYMVSSSSNMWLSVGGGGGIKEFSGRCPWQGPYS